MSSSSAIPSAPQRTLILLRLKFKHSNIVQGKGPSIQLSLKAFVKWLTPMVLQADFMGGETDSQVGIKSVR